jgi:TIR domain
VDDDVARVPAVFLSHASEDKAGFAEPLGRELASLGIRPWLDKWEIRLGDSLVRKLFDEGVAAVDAVIVVVSQYSAGKPWVRAELDAAVVRRITDNTRLIPIRLDGADMPAPLQPLVWHDAARTEDGIRRAARLIADTIHDRDARPAVAPPPAYTSTVRVPGLTAADTTLLTLLAEEAISANSLLSVPWPTVVARAVSHGLDEALATESLAVLEQRRYAKRRPIHAGGAIVAVELAARGFRAVADAIIPDAETARQRIIASVVNTPSNSTTVVDDLAALTGTPPLFVLQFLRELEAKGLLKVVLTLGGFSRVAAISPALKRMLQ